MTEELAGIEMFRSDFINNFSHEFKTPIVSILGFARLLKTRKLDPAQSREAILLLESKWAEKQITFDIDMDEILINADESLLKQAWVNLLDIAIKFSPAEGCIIITLHPHNENVLFTVEDNGPGMDKKAEKFIFDKFYQGDPSHYTEGNGLGLPLVKKIIELHKGTISVKSETGKGSAFIVELPSTVRA